MEAMIVFEKLRLRASDRSVNTANEIRECDDCNSKVFIWLYIQMSSRVVLGRTVMSLNSAPDLVVGCSMMAGVRSDYRL